jgi:magnesium transporter
MKGGQMTIKELNALFDENKLKCIHEELTDLNPVDLATLLSELDEDKLVVVFRLLDKDKAAEVFSYMDNDLRQTLIRLFSKQDIKAIFESIYADDAVDFLSDMPANVVTQLLENVDKETRANINFLLQYPENSAGSIMTVEFIELKPDMTVKQALDKIRKVGLDSETVYTCYVVDKHKLIGIVSAKDLMINDGDKPITELMKENFLTVHTNDDRETVANMFRKYGLLAIPVLDSEDYIVGIVTFDDAITVLTREATEDMQKMAAMIANEDPYLKTSVWEHAKHRIIWLLILMLSATITGTIIASYEIAIATIPLLVSFIPMLMDTGGNCGSQSSTLIIRGFAVDELHFSDTLKIVWKEFRVSLLVGAALALANGIRIMLMYNRPDKWMLALVVSISLICTVIIAKMVGCLLPIIAKKCKLDPAIMAAPLITTIIDTLSIIIYFFMATTLFKL